jgi:hypothetical protein
MTGNWNRCIELARATFLTFCHDDDTLLPHALTRLMEVQKVAKECAVFSAMNNINAAGELIAEHQHSKSKWGVLIAKDCYQITLFDCIMSNRGYNGGILLAKKRVIELGGYTEDFSYSADNALAALYTHKFGAFHNDVPVINYRISVNSSFTILDEALGGLLKLHQCIKNKLPFPKQISEIIIAAYNRYMHIHCRITLGLADPSALKSLSLKDKLILKLCWIYLIPKKYKLKPLFQVKNIICMLKCFSHSYGT